MHTMPSSRRRPLLVALLGGAAAVTGIGVAARTGLLPGAEDGSPAGDGVLRLTAGVMGVEALELPLTDQQLAPDGPGRWRSPPLATTGHTMVGFTWSGGDVEPRIDIRARIRGVWRPWARMPHVIHAPDADSGEATTTVGTDVVWIGLADGIRVRVRDNLPRDLAMVLLYPTPLPGDDAATTPDAPSARVGAASPTEEGVPAPALLSRHRWGADESWRNGRPAYVETIQQVHVHHTANSNTYGRSDVPALIRGMYAYHTQSLGWSDIAYNFLVDRFGRVWVGRAGGADEPVRGAHTLGFNATSTGVAAIGNFDLVEPGHAVLGAIARVAAWKLYPYGGDPLGRTPVLSEGSDKFRRGRRVTLPVIDGHRDTNDTACPGQHLYDALPGIRRRAQTRIDRSVADPRVEVTQPFEGAGITVDGEVITVAGGTWVPAEASPSFAWLRDGQPVESAAGDSYRLTTADVGSVITVRITLTAAGHEAAEQIVTFPDPVKARTVLDVRAVGRRGRAVVRVTATTPGLDVPLDEPVSVTMGGQLRQVVLQDGKARTVFRGLPPGRYDAQVEFAGSPSAAAASAADSATVRTVG